MTKTSKKLLALLLTFCAVLACLSIFVACGDDPETPTEVTYTVTVQKDADTPVADVTVAVKKGTATIGTPQKTGADGKVTVNLIPDDYDVVLSYLPDHYEIPETVELKLTKTEHELTVTLVKSFSYKVKLKNADDTAYNPGGTDVNVQICDVVTEVCLEAVPVEADGTAEIFGAKSEYHVKVNGLPATLAYEADTEGYYVGVRNNENVYENANLTQASVELEIKLYPVTVLDYSEDKLLTDAQKKAFADIDEYDAYYEDCDEYSYPAQQLKKELTKGEVVDFAITPEFSGEYRFFTQNEYDADYTNKLVSYWYNRTQFVLGANTVAGGYLSRRLVLEAGKTYYFKACYDPAANNESAPEKIDANILITAPIASGLTTSAKTVDIVLTRPDAIASLEYRPTEAGKYTVTVQGETLAYVEYDEYGDYTPTDEREDADYVKNASAKAKFTERDARQKKSAMFGISAKLANADEYPLTLEVKIEKTAEITDTVNAVEVKSTLERFADPAADKELVPVNLSNPYEFDYVYEYDDATDRYKDAEGNELVVMLTGNVTTDRYINGGAFAYLELVDSALGDVYLVDVTPDADRDINSDKGNTYDDYRLMLRGFKDYTIKEGDRGSVYEKPTTLETDKCYAANVNKDGVYPLTKELREVLEAIAAHDYISHTGANWTYPLYYYADYIEEDVIVGGYEIVSFTENAKKYEIGDEYDGTNDLLNGIPTLERFSVVVEFNRRLTFTMTIPNDRMGDIVYAGTWEKTAENTYDLVLNDNWGYPMSTGTATYNNGKLTLNLTLLGLNESYEPVELPCVFELNKVVKDPIVGRYTIFQIVYGNKTYNLGDEFPLFDPDDPQPLQPTDIVIEIQWTGVVGGMSGTWEKKDGKYYLKYMTGMDEEYQPVYETAEVKYDATAKTVTVTITMEGTTATYVFKLAE